jgi:hypothetical protein
MLASKLGTSRALKGDKVAFGERKFYFIQLGPFFYCKKHQQFGWSYISSL